MLICIRHGESDANLVLHQLPADQRDAVGCHVANPGLTETGHKQAAATAGFLASDLAGKPIRLITSQLQRTILTSEPIVAALQASGSKVTVERWKSLNEKHEKTVGERIRETLPEFLERVKPVARRLADLDFQDTVIVVGHSVFISALTSFLLEPNVELVDLKYRNPNCAITIFMKPTSDKIQLVQQGSVAHLPLEIQTGVD
jgi:broad specificity phosphatase PhoE